MELKPIEYVQVISTVLMALSIGLATDLSETGRKIAQVFRFIFVVIVWVCIFVR